MQENALDVDARTAGAAHRESTGDESSCTERRQVGEATVAVGFCDCEEGEKIYALECYLIQCPGGVTIAPTSAATASTFPRNIRNHRERKRVQAVNEAFAKLRQMVPATRASSKRVSKCQTLRRAAEYIRELRRRL